MYPYEIAIYPQFGTKEEFRCFWQRSRQKHLNSLVYFSLCRTYIFYIDKILSGSELAVSRIAQSGQNVAAVVQALIDCCQMYRNFRMIRLH